MGGEGILITGILLYEGWTEQDLACGEVEQMSPGVSSSSRMLHTVALLLKSPASLVEA